MIGKIHSVETFGTVDGPGIRYVVFLKGCPLRCLYCHNPDTWDMASAKEKTVAELVLDIKRYRGYFGDKGGVTVSGGEPLLQLDFVIELFKALKKEGIHTALDTSGFLFDPSDERYLQLILYTDLVLLDMKQIDPDKHRRLTGVSNAPVLAFASFLAEHRKKMWIRHVLMPGITTDSNDLKQLKDWIDTLPTVEKVEVLPYHTMGMVKYEKLGLTYPLKGVLPPSKEEVRLAKEILGVKKHEVDGRKDQK